MRYLPKSPAERREMLAAIGIASPEKISRELSMMNVRIAVSAATRRGSFR